MVWAGLGFQAPAGACFNGADGFGSWHPTSVVCICIYISLFISLYIRGGVAPSVVVLVVVFVVSININIKGGAKLPLITSNYFYYY